MVNDIAHAPVKDIANIVTDNYGGFTSSQRVNQFLSSRNAWETVKKVTNGTSVGIILRKICLPLFSLLNGGRK